METTFTTQILVIAAGGSLGAVLRFWVSNGIHALLGRNFPYGTLVVNVLGCLLVGLLWAWFLEHPDLGLEWRTAVLVGVLGAFTTFSSFAIETLTLQQEGRWMAATVNIALSVLICLAAMGLGMRIGTELIQRCPT